MTHYVTNRPAHRFTATEVVRVRQSASTEALKVRVRAEYREMPGLCLTLPQACRLWQIDVRASASILEALVAEGFLRRTSEGAFKAED